MSISDGSVNEVALVLRWPTSKKDDDVPGVLVLTESSVLFPDG